MDFDSLKFKIFDNIHDEKNNTNLRINFLIVRFQITFLSVINALKYCPYSFLIAFEAKTSN